MNREHASGWNPAFSWLTTLASHPLPCCCLQIAAFWLRHHRSPVQFVFPWPTGLLEGSRERASFCLLSLSATPISVIYPAVTQWTLDDRLVLRISHIRRWWLYTISPQLINQQEFKSRFQRRSSWGIFLHGNSWGLGFQGHSVLRMPLHVPLPSHWALSFVSGLPPRWQCSNNYIMESKEGYRCRHLRSWALGTTSEQALHTTEQRAYFRSLQTAGHIYVFKSTLTIICYSNINSCRFFILLVVFS